MIELVKDVPGKCAECGAPLCVRKQVINLALGNVEALYCLICLSKSEETQPDKLISGMVGYILGRDCFRKEWTRYTCVADCPEPKSCFPQTCFNGKVDV